MNILSIDTSTRFLCIALDTGDRQMCATFDFGRLQSRLLAVTIERVCAAAGVPLASLDYCACGIGPGSFTGVRMGVSAVKGLAWALRKPVITFSSLDLVAAHAGAAAHRQVAVAMDAKRGLVYGARYRRVGGVLVRSGKPVLLTPQAFCATLAPGTALFGDAWAAYGQALQACGKRLVSADKDYWYPRAEYLIELVRAARAAGKVTTAFAVQPEYLYPKECQIQR